MTKSRPPCQNVAWWLTWSTDHIIRSDQHDQYAGQCKIGEDNIG